MNDNCKNYLDLCILIEFLVDWLNDDKIFGGLCVEFCVMIICCCLLVVFGGRNFGSDFG